MGKKLKYKGKGFQGVKSGINDRKNWTDQFEPVRWTSQFPDKTVLVRFTSDLFPVGVHWVYTSLEDLGKNSYSDNFVGKKYMVTCPDWNPEEEKSSKTSCFICKHLTSKDYLGSIRITWYVQAFVAKKKDGKIKWASEPIVIELPTTAINEIKTMVESVGNGVEPSDPKHGYAIWLTYKNSGAGKSSWSAQKDKEISIKELGLSKDDIIDFGEYFEPTPVSDINESMERLGYVDLIENGGKKKKSKSIDDDEDEEDSLDVDDEEDDDKPSKKKKSKKGKFDEDEEEEEDSDDEDDGDNNDDDDEYDDSEDEEEENDDDEEDEDSEDDEDDKPSKKKKSKKGKFDEDEDEDEEKVKKSKKKKSKKFDDDDEDEDDDKPSKKKKSKKGKFDDDDDD